MGFADPSSELWIICKSYIYSYHSFLIFFLRKQIYFKKKKKSKILWIGFEETNSFALL